ncbi:MAG: recombination-associated protein RdgC [Deltaproteobacteria bacterium]|nr:recombination-associated protein RdgC [Deltaproteobacteria bacterium]
MSLLKGSVTFTRFRIAGNHPAHFSTFIDERLKKYAFRESAVQGDEDNTGWTSLENILDTDFKNEEYALGDYLLFSLRIDRKMVPASLLKVRLLEGEKKLRVESGGKRIYREQREILKEQIRAGLLENSHPIPSFHGVCWSVSKNMLFFSSLTEKASEEFQDLFKRSFGLTVYPFVPWEGASMADNETTASSTTAGKARTHKAAGADESTPAFSPGREFLTWLWFKSEERGGTVMIPDLGDTGVTFLRRIVLESGDGDYSESVVCQGLHSDLKEGKEALRRGKKIKEARIKLTRDAADWEFTLKADYFHFQSMKLPVAPDEEEEKEADGRTLERIYLMETAAGIMDRLFELFLTVRRSPGWITEELPRMEKWLHQ